MAKTMFLTDADQIGVREGSLYKEAADDCGDDGGGFNIRFDYYVEVVVPSGKTFVLPHPYRFRAYAERKVGFVRARGAINLDLWDEVEVISLEERFALYAQNEDEVRHGYRSEEDLYHGVP